MKRLLSIFCVIALFCALVAPLSVINVSAAAWDDWTMARDAYVQDGILYMKSTEAGSGPQATKSMSYPEQYTVRFSMKVVAASSSMGVQGSNGVHRFGFYIHKGSMSAMGSGQSVSISDMGNWHDYAIEVDHAKETMVLYVDEEPVKEFPLEASNYPRNQLYFFMNNAGGNMEISDFKFTNDVVIDESVLTITDEYTEPFYQDWYDAGGWMLDNPKFVTHYPEEGVVRLNVIDENLTYRSIERPLRAPTNYDMEMRIRIPEMPEGIMPGSTAIELSTDNRHTWLHIWDEYLTYNNYSQDGSDPLYEGPNQTVAYNTDTEWHVWKASVRDRYITWYVDGKEVVSFQMLKTGTNRWHLSFFQQNYSPLAGDIFIDWVKYTPYFEDELKMETPVNDSSFVEGKEVYLKAVPKADVEKVDYYVNDIYVGSGVKEDNYVYTLKDVKVGTYNVKAKMANIETVPWTFHVKKALKPVLSLDKTEILQGENLKAVVYTNDSDDAAQIVKTEFFVNGELKATDTAAPFETNIVTDRIGTTSVYAKAYNKYGTVGETDLAFIDVKRNENSTFAIGGEYEVSYDYSSGTGTIALNDGYFNLDVKNNSENVVFKTAEGEQTYGGLGYGKYRIIVTAGYAELYWKDQYVTSFVLPNASGTTAFSHNGVENVKIGGSGVKALLYEKKLNGNGSFSEENIPEEYYYSIEFDKTDSSSETLHYRDGMFEHKLSFREDGIYAQEQTKAGREPVELKLADTVEPGYYRLTVYFGLAQLFRNNKLVASYTARLYYSGRGMTRQMTNPGATTFIAVKKTDDVFYHTDDFENTAELDSAEYWQARCESYKTPKDVPKVTRMEKAGNHYMNLSGSGTYMLNGIARDPYLKWRAMADTREGMVYTVLRRSFSDYHTKIGYNFDKGQWFYEVVNATGKVISSKTKDDPTAFAEGVWHNFELICDNLDVKLMCDGNEAFSVSMDNNKTIVYWGRSGFGVKNAKLNFDDVEYSGAGRVSPGFTFFTSAEYSGLASSVPTNFYLDAEGAVYATNEYGSLKSTDGGKTWGNMEIPETAAPGKIFRGQLAIMPDGTIVTATYDDNGLYAHVSKDGGLSWEKHTISDEYVGKFGSANRISCTMSGRVFVPVGKGTEYYGWSEIFYSDDGVNWHKSETTITTYNTGSIMNEQEVIDAPRENEVWMLARSSAGYIDYWISKDGGKTFDLTPHHLDLMQSAMTFRVERDWENPNTYYALFGYESPLVAPKDINAPRTRYSLAVSYDGMESWEYLTTVIEGNESSSIMTSDGSIKFLDDHLYWRATNFNGNGGVNFGALDLTKAKTAKRFTAMHYRNFTGFDLIKNEGYEHSVLPKTDGEGWIHGDVYDVKVKDGRIDAATAEKVFGVKVETSGNTATLCMGDGKVTLTEGATTFDVNGESRTAEKAVYQGGYLDIAEVCKIFGKTFRVTGASYLVMNDAEQVEFLQDMMDNMLN